MAASATTIPPAIGLIPPAIGLPAAAATTIPAPAGAIPDAIAKKPAVIRALASSPPPRPPRESVPEALGRPPRRVARALGRKEPPRQPLEITMNVLPDRDVEAIEFSALHGEAWSAAPERIGLTGEQCEALRMQAEAAEAAYAAALAAREAAKAATITLDQALRTMRGTAAIMIKTIKTFAARQEPHDRTEVYAAAQIPLPRAASPLPPPGAAMNIQSQVLTGAGPEALGAVRLTWTARGAAPSTGALFEVMRGDADDGPLTLVGVAQGGARGRFEFTDHAVARIDPAQRPSSVRYILVPVRGRQRGAMAGAIAVRLCVGPSAPAPALVTGAATRTPRARIAA